MATSHVKGSARFTYTPPDDDEVVTHLLATPLQDLEPIDHQSRFEWQSADKTTREVVTVGEPVHDLRGTIRRDDQPNELRRMLRHGLDDDVTLTYRLSAEGTAFPAKIVAFGAGADSIPIRPDRGGHRPGEWECRIQLRRVDGETWDALLDGSAT